MDPEPVTAPPPDPDAWAAHLEPGEIPVLRGYEQQVNAFQDQFARKNGRVRRGFHVKAHAVMWAQFRVADALPEQARGGVFVPGASYNAWLRVSNGYSARMPDWFPDLLGFSVKLLDVAGPKLVPGEEHAGTQDLLALNVPYLPADDANDLVIISLATGNFLTAPFKVLFGLGLVKTFKLLRWALGWLPRRLFLRSAFDQSYCGVAPISIGSTPVKFLWRPVPGKPASRQTGDDRLRKDIAERLELGEVRYDFLVQFFQDEQRTPLDGGWAWSDAPWVRVAELVVLPGALDMALEAKVDGLAFNPWHGLEAHRPRGNIQRARGPVYQASAAHRGAGKDPTGGS